MTEPIKIFRGDDTDFIGNKVIEITLDTDIDLSGITADFLLCGFKQHFGSETVASKRLEVVISHEETKRFPLGRQLGTLVLKSADGKIKHVDTQIEFFVTNKTGFPMFCGDEQIKARFGLKIKWDDIRDTPTTLAGYGITDAVKSVNGKFPDENGNVEVETGGGGTSDYNDLSNKPSINAVTLSGNKTAAELGLATAAQGAKANTAYQKPQGGIPASDMTQAVQNIISLFYFTGSTPTDIRFSGANGRIAVFGLSLEGLPILCVIDNQTPYVIDLPFKNGTLALISDIPSVAGLAPLASPAFTGTPTAPTPNAADNSNRVATTAFVKTAISGISVTPLAGQTFDFATTQGVMDALKATIEALGGTVTNAPTTPVQNNQTQGE